MRDAEGRNRSTAPRARAAMGALALAAALGAAGAAHAATGVELTPTLGWQWGGTLDYSAGGSVHIDAALNYGGALGVMIRPGYWGEVGYTYQSSEVIARPPAAADFKLFDLGTHYIQFSGARNFANTDPGARAYPYVIGGLGMTILSPGSSSVPLNADTQYLFSMSAGAGLRVTMNERSDIRLQARFLLPLNWSEGSVYFGSGGGGVSVSGGTAMPQGEVTLGAQLKVTK